MGQKKIRSEDSVFNTITIEEFFSRYPTLPKFLLTSLRQTFNGLVHPSLVPLLVLFSRISLGASNSYDRNNDLISQFKEAFKDTFSSPVINVRKLAARAYVNFTSKDNLIDEIDNFCSQCLFNNQKNNYVDACLYCVNESIKMLRKEYRDVFSDNYDRIVTSVKKLASLDERNCCIKLNILQIWKQFDISDNDIETLNCKILPFDNFSSIHPGYKNLVLEYSKEQQKTLEDPQNATVDSRETCHQYISSISSINMEPNELCRKVQIFVEENIERNVMTGKIYEECNDILIKHYKAILNDPELAMDILELNSENQIHQRPQFGIMAKTTSLIVQAVCFASMMTQVDYKMFFGDESVYVSMFSKMAEDIEGYSKPNKMETCRIHCAQSLKFLIPVFNKRSIKVDFDPLVMYAFVKLANTAFTLLNDEDNQVREMVTNFVSELKTDMPYPENVSTRVACEKLIRYGLEQFSSCIEWFLPVEEVFFRPWIFDIGLCDNAEYPSHILRRIGIREYLFESGDGINVFIEEVGQNFHYTSVITKWLREKKDRLPYKLNMNMKSIFEQVTSLMKYIDTHSYVKDYSGELWTSKGFILLLRYYNMLSIIKEHPSLVDLESYGSDSDALKEIDTFIVYVNKSFPHFINCDYQK